MGGLSFTSTGGFSWPNAAGGGVFCCASEGVWLVSCCAHNATVPKASPTKMQIVWRIFIVQSSSRYDNGVTWLQNQVLVDGLAFDQRSVGHRNLLLLSVFHAQHIDALGVGKLRKARARQGLQYSHVRLKSQGAGVGDLAHHVDPA